MDVYPIGLIGLEQQKTVVIGGGKVAARKVTGLLEAGAQVTVISPAFVPELRVLAGSRRVTLTARAYQDGDLADAFLVIAATNNAGINERVWQEARTQGCLVNVVDHPAHCNFIVPAVVRRGEVAVTVSTGGASPALARRLREQLESLIGPEVGELADLLAELRPELQTRFPDEELRTQAAFRLVDSNLAELIRRQGIDAARLRAEELLAEMEVGGGVI
jgi:precorrin-2 dehydrogenase/sirohydrochlorin ferrochelatase